MTLPLSFVFFTSGYIIKDRDLLRYAPKHLREVVFRKNNTFYPAKLLKHCCTLVQNVFAFLAWIFYVV